MSVSRITPLHLEWNSYNWFIFELIGLELDNYEGSLFGLSIAPNFFYINILFFSITIKSSKL
jgi:hypothetical protein